MDFNQSMLIISVVIMPIATGIGSYIASTTKSKKDITQLREQSKLEIDKLMNQHKMDLESLERKHQMEVEKIELEHRHKIEMTQKEMENDVGSNLFNEVISQAFKSPEIQKKMNESLIQSMTKKKKR